MSTCTPVLAASPDRVLDDELIVEVKCPYAAKGKEIIHVTVPYLVTNATGELELKSNHDYNYQVQGQLYCSGRSACDFVVYTIKDINLINVIRIQRNQEFIREMVEKLMEFHLKYHKHALIAKHVYINYYNYTFF